MRYGGTFSNLLSMVGGAGVGAAIMYLFDPERGEERREYVGEIASEAAQRTGDALSSTWHNVRDKTSEYGRAAYGGLSSFGGMVAERAGEASQSGGRSMRRMGRGVSDRLRQLTGRRRTTLVERLNLPQILGAVGLIGLGAGLMYLMDPTAGRQRRHYFRDKAVSSSRRVGDQVQKKGRDLWNRATGTISEVRSRMGGGQAADHVLIDRIRAEMGHRITTPAFVVVEADEGQVTLSGHVLQREFDDLMKCVWAVPGVKDVINRLETHERVEDMPQGAASQRLVEPSPQI